MKFLMVINSMHTGGAEKMVATILPLMRSAGIDADLLLIDGTQTPFLKLLQTPFDGKIHILGGKLYSPFHPFKMIRLFKQYDLVHVHLFPVLYWAAIAKFLGRGNYKLIFTEHSTSNNRRGNFLLRLADKMIYRQYDKLVCITDEVKTLLQKHTKLHDNHFTIIHNGIDLQAILNAEPYAKSSLGVNDDNFVLVQVSSFRYPKDQATVVKSLQNLPEKVVLLLVGEGPELQSVKNLVAGKNLNHRVHFLGVRTDVPQILKTADVVLLSSAYEGLSLSSLEGLASGKPFVATDVAGLRDIVNGYGILFPLGDEKKLSDEIIKLMSDSAHYEKMAQLGLARANDFNIEQTVSEHIKLYQSL